MPLGASSSADASRWLLAAACATATAAYPLLAIQLKFLTAQRNFFDAQLSLLQSRPGFGPRPDPTAPPPPPDDMPEAGQEPSEHFPQPHMAGSSRGAGDPHDHRMAAAGACMSVGGSCPDPRHQQPGNTDWGATQAGAGWRGRDASVATPSRGPSPSCFFAAAGASASPGLVPLPDGPSRAQTPIDRCATLPPARQREPVMHQQPLECHYPMMLRTWAGCCSFVLGLVLCVHPVQADPVSFVHALRLSQATCTLPMDDLGRAPSITKPRQHAAQPPFHPHAKA